MKLKHVVENLDMDVLKGSLDTEITGVVYDSRKAIPGSLFVCIEGYKTDGHKYIASAIENGALAVLVQKDISTIDDVTVMKTKDTRFALAYVSDRFFSHPSRAFPLVGVTGTKGKTTTTYMIKSILEADEKKVGLIGTVENSIGSKRIPAQRTTPESYDLQVLFDRMKEEKVEAVVMEVSSQGLKLHRASCSDYDIGVFTNLSKDHIGRDEHPDMEDYFNSKLKLFQMCKKGLVNLDSPYAQKVMENAACEMFTFGVHSNANVIAENIQKFSDHVMFHVRTPWGTEKIDVSVPGEFSVYNALAAIGVCGLMGISMDCIKKGLRKISVPGRAEVVPTPSREFTVMIDYAHSPDSLENILQTVKAFAPSRLISVFGCGGDRDRSKRPVMGEISGEIADFTILTSDNPRTEEPG
ncbi:MAG: UDP-N-acetylmuramoyl-L-alanyl-D-glutamate--2,6-diaminopimelate ligase, partial [Proteobacteria bacterium]|nr:UDP-N-acetylmuramoyl-L-alanyl-D-glutamate--2,6-diaminopimelate ligase [Pseudomonadota bacterium]